MDEYIGGWFFVYDFVLNIAMSFFFLGISIFLIEMFVHDADDLNVFDVGQNCMTEEVSA